MNNPKASIRAHLLEQAARSRLPLDGSFELTPQCNLNCKMCYIHTSDGLPAKPIYAAEHWLRLAGCCVEQGMLFLLLTGGEPFLHPEFRTIYEGCRALGLYLSVNTNGVLVTEEQLQWLAEDPPIKFNVSLYGASRETYAALCGAADGYERAKRTVLRAKELGIPVSVNLTVTKENADDYPALVAFCTEHDLPYRQSSYLFPAAKPAGLQAKEYERMAPEACGAFWLENLLLTKGRDAVLSHVRQQLDGVSVKPVESDCELQLAGLPLGCAAGKCAFWVNWEGKLSPCGLMKWPQRPLSLKTITAEAFREAWEWVAKETDALCLPAACSECSARELCNICGAIAQAEQATEAGSRPEYLCRTMEAFLQCAREYGMMEQSNEGN